MDKEQSEQDLLNHSGPTLERSLERAGDELGFFENIGRRHMAIFLDADTTLSEDDRATLLVTFVQAGPDDMGLADICPLGHHLRKTAGWAQLCVVATEETWFRDPALYGFFDRLVDDAFFEDFDKVIFMGSQMGAYAAAAFSVAAPGASVVLFSPRATLSPDRAGWDGRHRQARRLDFTTRYGYGPAMSEAAAEVFVIYDPLETEDAMHAALFGAPHVQHLPIRLQGPDTAEEVDTTGFLAEMVVAIDEGIFDRLMFYRWFRRRRRVRRYLRRLLAECERRERPYLTAMAARAMMTYIVGQRIRDAYSRACAQLDAEGRQLPPQRVKVLQSA
ncbi:hypothetical protein BV394_13815 [Brevirhabdus pacifica]|uniref:Uncharacterized protein n=1 Tax=Brevirhabdus pacifica TaxID=1267768 RepID=A0A1U7DL13_9RHOB|nr:hypothetical protein [Brevirhabdus pacifica]APX90661.1 hypothetical protein BV394_13815 [Brevirhabdus pacifica]PJJ85192.1 hypothetical protein CLV77_2058 [Brevirhabdus pacifica]